MKCPHCHNVLPSVACCECGAETLEGGSFCSQCGKPIEQRKEEKEEADFSERILCKDGTCIGIINEKGVCNICGKPYADEPG